MLRSFNSQKVIFEITAAGVWETNHSSTAMHLALSAPELILDYSPVAWSVWLVGGAEAQGELSK